MEAEKAMKALCKALAAALLAAAAAAPAAVRVAWTNAPGQPPHVALAGRDGPAFAPGADVRLWWQTNGMGAEWWSAPASVSGNVASASFGAGEDVGADRYSAWFGTPSNAYAPAVLRFLPSPGWRPGELPPPARYIDFSVLELRGIAALTNGWDLAPTPANYPAVSNAAMRAAKMDDTRLPYTVDDPVAHGFETFLLRDWIYPRSLLLPGWAAAFRWRLPDDAPGGVSDLASTGYVDRAIAAIPPPVEESDPVWTADKPGFATKAALAAVGAKADAAALDASSALRIVLGESVWFAVTNYMRTAAGVVPSLQLWEVRDGQTNLVYHSSEEIANTVHALFGDLAGGLTNALPSRAWGAYQSGTGADNPDPANTTIVTTPQVMLTGGGEWNRYVSTGGSSVWVLHSSGLTGFGGGADGSFLRVEDDEGNAQFEVSRTDSYEVDAVPSSCRFDDTTGDFYVTYDYNGSAPPVAYASTSLRAGSFVAEDARHEIDAYGLTVTWTQASGGGNWTAAVHQDSTHTRLFIHAKATMPGSIAIINNAPTIMGGGILYNSKTYLPTVNGTKLEFVEAP